MLAGTEALFTRAVRADVRRISSHVYRMVFAVLILVSLVLSHMISSRLGAPGLFFFGHICWLNLVLLTLAGISFFATAITEEKEEGTLGLLMMAGISPLAMLLGKSTTRLFSTGLLLMVQFPFALLAIVLGGVTLTQIVAAYVALGVYLVFLANLGLLASVLSRRSGTASGLVGLGLLVWVGGGYVLRPLAMLVIAIRDRGSREALGEMFGSGPVVDTISGRWQDLAAEIPVLEWFHDWTLSLDRLSIATRVYRITGTGFAEPILSEQVWVSLAWSVLLFTVAWFLFLPATRGSLVGVPPRGAVVRRRRRAWPLAWLAGFVGTGRTWSAAVAWREFHFTTGGVSWLLLKTVVYGGFVVGAGWVLYDPLRGMPLNRWVAFVEIGMLIAAATEMAVYASRVFHDERKYGTLAVTMGLPMGATRIVAQKLAGCGLALLPAGGWFLVAGLIDEREFQQLLGEWGLWALLLVYLVFLHLTLLLSLYVRWGALPLAIALLAIIAGCGYPLLMLPMAALGQMTGEDGARLMPAVYTCGVLIAVLLMLIITRLQTVSGE